MSKAIKKIFICDYLFTCHELSSDQQTELWKLVSKGIDEKNMGKAAEFCKGIGIASVESKGLFRKMYDASTELWNFLHSGQPDGPLKDAANAIEGLKAPDFFKKVDAIVERWPVLLDGAIEALRIAQDHYAEKIGDLLRTLPHRLAHNHTEFLKDRINKEVMMELHRLQAQAKSQLLSELEESYMPEQDRSLHSPVSFVRVQF